MYSICASSEECSGVMPIKSQSTTNFPPPNSSLAVMYILLFSVHAANVGGTLQSNVTVAVLESGPKGTRDTVKFWFPARLCT